MKSEQHNKTKSPDGQVIGWHSSSRIERISRFNLNGTPAEIFPLLCPVLEYDWLPDWKCTMCYSDSGVAEIDTVFHTKEQLGRTAVWTCITFEPDTFIEYLAVSEKDVVMRLSIRLEETVPEKTSVAWRMLFTMTSHLGKAVIKKAFSEEKFREMMASREKELNYYLKHGSMV